MGAPGPRVCAGQCDGPLQHKLAGAVPALGSCSLMDGGGVCDGVFLCVMYVW